MHDNCRSSIIVRCSGIGQGFMAKQLWQNSSQRQETYLTNTVSKYERKGEEGGRQRCPCALYRSPVEDRNNNENENHHQRNSHCVFHLLQRSPFLSKMLKWPSVRGSQLLPVTQQHSGMFNMQPKNSSGLSSHRSRVSLLHSGKCTL